MELIGHLQEWLLPKRLVSDCTAGRGNLVDFQSNSDYGNWWSRVYLRGGFDLNSNSKLMFSQALLNQLQLQQLIIYSNEYIEVADLE